MNTISKPIIYPNLSYKIMGALFAVHNRLGNQLQEKIYQRAVETEFTQQDIKFQREVYVPIVDRAVALELKANPTIYKKDIRQLLAYIALTKLRLGILANFRTIRLTYIRVVNAQFSDHTKAL